MSEICSHYAHLEIVRLVAETLPLVILWQLDLELLDFVPVCEGPEIIFKGTEKPLAEEETCEEAPTWRVLVPVENTGAYQMPLCPRHLALLFLNRDGNVT